MKNLLKKAFALVYPPTKAKLHRLVSLIGTAVAALAIVAAWVGQLGLPTTGKIGATLGIVTIWLSSWNALKPKLDTAIDQLPIPASEAPTQPVAVPPSDKPAA